MIEELHQKTEHSTMRPGDAGGSSSIPAGVLDTAHRDGPIDMMDTLRRMSAIAGRPPLGLAKEFFALSRGPGRLSFRDYLNYRLFDTAFVGGADKSAFIGRRRNQELNAEINYRHEWNCLSDDKVANASYLASYGLPVVPTKAIYAPHMGRSAGSLLGTLSDLRSFLAEPAHYPMFAKPTFGFQSLGSIVLKSRDPATDLIETSNGSVSVDALAKEIDSNFPDGFVFQPLMRNHADVTAAIGSGLSTARLVTIATDEGPRLFAAAWKIIGGGNIADNYWRSGNILAGVDLGSGRVTKAVTGHGLEMHEIESHPVTGIDLKNIAVPLWTSVAEVAIEGHRALRNLGIIGWDIGVTDRGPVVVETNIAPDLVLVQAANRVGAFNAELAALLKRQNTGAKAHRQAMKATLVRN